MRVNRVEAIALRDEKTHRFPEFSAPSIIIAGGHDVPHHSAGEAYPDIDPAPIMVGWINGEDGAGDVYTALSRDGGRTWDTPRLLRTVDERSRYGSVTLFAEDQFSYAFLGPEASGDPVAEATNLLAYVTSDLGETWRPLDVLVECESRLVTGGRLLSYCGHYLLPVHAGGRAGEGEQFQSALLSEDLVHWRRGGVVPGSIEAALSDGHITHTQPGEHENGLIMVMRESNGRGTGSKSADGHARFSLSDDCGESWSAASPYPEVPSLDARIFFATDSLGRYVTVFNATPDRRSLKVRVKEPRGPWGPVRDFPGPGLQNQDVDAVTFADIEF